MVSNTIHHLFKEEIPFRKGLLHGVTLCLLAMLVFAPFEALIAQPEAFIITVKTDNPGASNSTSYTIPTNAAYEGGYNYEVDWNDDGNYEEKGIKGDVTHDFKKAGTYTLRIRGAFPQISHYHILNSREILRDAQKLLEVKQWGTNVWRTMEYAFSGCTNLNITATDLPNTSEVVSMTDMFRGCSTLSGPSNIGNWNTAKVEKMASVFENASSFNQPIGDWNTEKVDYMSSMFSGASSFNQPIGKWNTAAVKTMERMFLRASSFNQPIGSWNTAAVHTMNQMFMDAKAFNQPIENWNTSEVFSLNQMFKNASSFNQPIGKWNLGKIRWLDGIGLDNCGMDCDNYSATLVGWANNPATRPGNFDPFVGVFSYQLPLNAEGMEYNAAAAAARATLINTKGWRISGDAECGSTVDFSSFIGKVVSFTSVNFPDRQMMVKDNLGVLEQPAAGSNLNSFKVVQALNGKAGLVSLESVAFPGHYLRHENQEIKLHQPNGTQIFKDDASFQPTAPLFATPEAVSFQSSNFPNQYIKHSGFKLRIAELENSDIFKKDATFVVKSKTAFIASNPDPIDEGIWFVIQNKSDLDTDNDIPARRIALKTNNTGIPIMAVIPLTGDFDEFLWRTVSYNGALKLVNKKLGDGFALDCSLQYPTITKMAPSVGQEWFLERSNLTNHGTNVYTMSNAYITKSKALQTISTDDFSGFIGKEVSFTSVNFPDRQMMVKDNLGVLEQPAAGSNLNSFKVVQALNGKAGLVSLESVAFPGHYLRHENQEIKLRKPDGSQIFKDDASFQPKAPLFATAGAVSFQSSNFPNQYIRHGGFKLMISELENSDIFNKDATFYVGGAISVTDKNANDTRQCWVFQPIDLVAGCKIPVIATHGYDRSMSLPFGYQLVASNNVSDWAMLNAHLIYKNILGALNNNQVQKIQGNTTNKKIVVMIADKDPSEVSSNTPYLYGTFPTEYVAENRGGSSPNGVNLITEEMMCREAVTSRGDPVKRYREFEQVVHEFAHAIDFICALNTREDPLAVAEFNGDMRAEWIAFKVQAWFNSKQANGPKLDRTTLTSEEKTYLATIFNANNTWLPPRWLRNR